MSKQIQVVQYDPNWPIIFQTLKQYIASALGENLLEIHHIGSTSVPGLAAKPKIDILAVVRNPSLAINQLETIGLQHKGEYNIPLHYGFSKRAEVNINLHMYEANHAEIELNLMFRDYLRQHLEAREAYAQLKTELLEDTSSMQKENSCFSNYTLRKGDFIRSILKAAGFNQIRILKCNDKTEWQAAKLLRQKYFLTHGKIDDLANLFNDANNTHLVLYQGCDIIGYAHIEFSTNIKHIIVESSDGPKEQFLQLIHKWLERVNMH